MNYSYIMDEVRLYYHKIKDLTERRGWVFVIRMLIGVVFGFAYYTIVHAYRTFTFRKKTYQYFYHPYNVTWMSERAVEIPIIWDIVQRNKGKRILEFGNVLSHYFNVEHDILDKYEKAKGVINEDVVHFDPKKKYDLIISISTLEHVGWDENSRYPGRNPKKIISALQTLKRCLTESGKVIFTLPLGHNHYLDTLLKNKALAFSTVHCMKRVSADNQWTQTRWGEVEQTQYDHPYIAANGLVIATARKSP